MENKQINSANDFFDSKFREMQDKKISDAKLAQAKKEEKEEKNRKNLIRWGIAGLSVLLAGLIALTSFVLSRKNKKSKPEDLVIPPAIVSVEDLGMEEEFPKKEENKQFGNTTGEIDKDKLVDFFK